MKRILRFGLVAVILILCTGCDQLAKNYARTSLAPAAPSSLLNDLVRVEYTENPGAILGLGANLPGEVRLSFFVLFVSAIMAVTLVLAFRVNSTNLVQLAGLACIAAGGVGNLLDRLYNNGAVVDFLNLGIGPLRTGIFNLADLAIVIGVVVLLLSSARREQPPATEQEAG